jgi:hypothetical protein
MSEDAAELFTIYRSADGSAERRRLGEMCMGDVLCSLIWVDDIEPDPAAAARLRGLIGEALPQWQTHPAMRIHEAIQRYWNARRDPRS